MTFLDLTSVTCWTISDVGTICLVLYKNYGSSEGMSYRGFFTSAAFWAGVGLCVSNVVGGLYWKREFAQAERSAALGQARGLGADDDVGASLIESRAGSERP